MKSAVRWFVAPFGSLRVLAMLAFVLLLGRMADLGSTYWFLRFNMAEEGNPISRMLFASFGFFGGAIAQLFISLIVLLLLSVAFFYLLRELNLRLAKITATAILISFGLGYLFVVAFHNLGFFRFLYLTSPSYYTFVFSTHLIWLFLAVVFFLYKIEWGKEKIT